MACYFPLTSLNFCCDAVDVLFVTKDVQMLRTVTSDETLPKLYL